MTHPEFKAALAEVLTRQPDRVRPLIAAVFELAATIAESGVDPWRVHWPEGFRERAQAEADKVARRD